MLGFAWDAEAFTASDVIESVGLTRSTTIDVIDELVARGLLSELPNARAAGTTARDGRRGGSRSGRMPDSSSAWTAGSRV